METSSKDSDKTGNDALSMIWGTKLTEDQATARRMEWLMKRDKLDIPSHKAESSLFHRYSYMFYRSMVLAILYIIYTRIPKAYITRLLIPSYLILLWRMKAPTLDNKEKQPKNAPYHLPFIGGTLHLSYGMIMTGIDNYFLNLDRNIGFQTYELACMDKMKMVVLHDPVDRKYVLKDNWRNFLKNVPDSGVVGLQDMMPELLGLGIFSSDGQEWQDQRKVASHIFAVSNMKACMESVFESHSNTLCALLERKIIDNNGEIEIDIQDMFQSFTFDTICRVAFGYDAGALESTIHTGKRVEFLEAFDSAQQIGFERGVYPRFIWQALKLLRIGHEGQLANDLELINRYVKNIIHERKKQGDIDAGNDLLSTYIQHARKTNQSFMEENDYLRDVVLNMMVAGRDTTSNALTNLMKCIGTSKNKDCILKRLRDELDVCDRMLNDKSMQLTAWDVYKNNCPYFDACFQETIRRYPPVPANVRIAVEDDVLPGSGFKVSSGTRCHIPILSIGRNPRYWTSPNDYEPERWMEGGERKDNGNKVVKDIEEYEYPVFWAGPRMCLGRDMARYQLKIVAGRLLRQFDIDIKDHDERYVNGPVMFYEGGIRAAIRIRR